MNISIAIMNRKCYYSILSEVELSYVSRDKERIGVFIEKIVKR